MGVTSSCGSSHWVSADAARAQDCQRGRRRNGKTAVGAVHPAGAFHNGARQHSRPAQQFQPDARAHDVHDRIHRADFVKMDLLGGNPCTLPSASAMRSKTAIDFCFTHVERGLAAMQFFNPGKSAAVLLSAGPVGMRMGVGMAVWVRVSSS